MSESSADRLRFGLDPMSSAWPEERAERLRALFGGDVAAIPLTGGSLVARVLYFFGGAIVSVPWMGYVVLCRGGGMQQRSRAKVRAPRVVDRMEDFNS